ncbi:MAG TPA: winged helix DNA-binding domain-containing protein [Methanoregulaceae archaeon]|nr:winged helix DNA-binding domain-containing protein [Methanoregulaceae archaeon]
MKMSDIAIDRLYSQQLEKPNQTSPEGLVSYMGAIQAQDFTGAKWSVGLRLPGSSDADIEAALGTGAIVRTWALRGTLHFVAGRDIHWLLAIIAPYVIKRNTRRYRELGLDPGTLDRSNGALSDALQGGRQLDRRALRALLEENSVSTEGQRFPYMLQRASLDGIICQVGMRRNNPVFARIDEWLPKGGISGSSGGAGELARRYFMSRGPATLQDFVWWSGLPVMDARNALESVKSQFITETIFGKTFWRTGNQPATPKDQPVAYLLPGFDEYLLGYRDRSMYLERLGGMMPAPVNGVMARTMVTAGQVVGTWKRAFTGGSVAAVPDPLVPLSGDERRAFANAANRFGEFQKGLQQGDKMLQ